MLFRDHQTNLWRWNDDRAYLRIAKSDEMPKFCRSAEKVNEIFRPQEKFTGECLSQASRSANLALTFITREQKYIDYSKKMIATLNTIE